MDKLTIDKEKLEMLKETVKCFNKASFKNLLMFEVVRLTRHFDKFVDWINELELELNNKDSNQNTIKIDSKNKIEKF